MPRTDRDEVFNKCLLDALATWCQFMKTENREQGRQEGSAAAYALNLLDLVPPSRAPTGDQQEAMLMMTTSNPSDSDRDLAYGYLSDEMQLARPDDMVVDKTLPQSLNEAIEEWISQGRPEVTDMDTFINLQSRDWDPPPEPTNRGEYRRYAITSPQDSQSDYYDDPPTGGQNELSGDDSSVDGEYANLPNWNDIEAVLNDAINTVDSIEAD